MIKCIITKKKVECVIESEIPTSKVLIKNACSRPVENSQISDEMN